MKPVSALQYDHFKSLLFSENLNLGPQNEDDAEVWPSYSLCNLFHKFLKVLV